MINVILNRKKIIIAKETTILALVISEGFSKPFAVAINKLFIPHHQHDDYCLKEGDSIDIVMPMQGG